LIFMEGLERSARNTQAHHHRIDYGGEESDCGSHALGMVLR